MVLHVVYVFGHIFDTDCKINKRFLIFNQYNKQFILNDIVT